MLLVDNYNNIILRRNKTATSQMDWKNRLDQIKNKLKLQIHARGIDSVNQMQPIFDVSSYLDNRSLT